MWGLSRLLRRPSGLENTEPAIAAIADAIVDNLRALNLFVERRAYGRRFVEIKASTSAKIITTPDCVEASGLALLLAGAYDPPTLVVEQINSLERGLGRRMVGAAMAGLAGDPGVFGRVRVNDLSPRRADGRRWWEHVADDYRNFDWVLTHDEDVTHSSAPRAESGDDAPLEAFASRQARLEALAREFGYDPDKVTLRAERKTFAYLGQSFTSEGEAHPDGRIDIFYDPNMSDARLACCLAHEIQHARYFAVRDAFRAEGEDGPLHRRFANYTPQLLASQRGVSNYSNEHWDAWTAAAPPRLFSDELADGASEPINETIAEVAKAQYNWGAEVAINPVWRELKEAIDEEYERLRRRGPAQSQRR